MNQRVLVLAAHTDDEIGCAGTILRLLEEGAKVRYLALSACEDSVPEEFPASTLRDECARSMSILGVDDFAVLNYSVRTLPAYRQGVLERLVDIRRNWEPHLVLCPATGDLHQDHEVVTKEALRAFRRSSVWGYEMPQNVVSWKASLVVELRGSLLAKKVEAMGMYASQEFRGFHSEEFIYGWATMRAAQHRCVSQYAEVFEALRIRVPVGQRLG